MLRARFEPITGLRIAVTEPDISPQVAASRTTLLGAQKRWMEDDGPFLWHDKAYKITRHSEIDIVLDHLCRLLRERVLPVLEACTTIEAFDRALNPPPGTESFFSGYVGGIDYIFAAYLARNPQLEEICQKYDPRSRGRTGEQDVIACIDYVRSHPLPPLDEGARGGSVGGGK